jgi:hypothetical protein
MSAENVGKVTAKLELMSVGEQLDVPRQWLSEAFHTGNIRDSARSESKQQRVSTQNKGRDALRGPIPCHRIPAQQQKEQTPRSGYNQMPICASRTKASIERNF